MMYLKHSLVAAAALIAGLAHTVAGASAAPLSGALSHPGKSDVQRVGWGWGYRYYDGPYDYRPYYYRPYYYQYPREPLIYLCGAFLGHVGGLVVVGALLLRVIRQARGMPRAIGGHAATNFRRARNRLASAKSANTCAPFLAMPR